MLMIKCGSEYGGQASSKTGIFGISQSRDRIRLESQNWCLPILAMNLMNFQDEFLKSFTTVHRIRIKPHIKRFHFFQKSC